MRPSPLLALALWAAPLAAQPAGDAASRRAAAEGRFVRALTAHRLGDDSTAARVLDEVLRERPDDPAVLDARAEVALELGDAPAALYYAAQAATHAPDEAAIHLRLAQALRETGDVGGAIRALDAARRLDPTDPAPLVALVDLHAEAGDAEAEREALEALVRIGDTPAARLRLSALYERSGDLDRARAEARAALRLAPGEPAVRRRLDALNGVPKADPAARRPATSGPAGASGEALYSAGRYEEAADALLDVVGDDPRRIDAWALALDALAQTADPRAGATADDALLLFPSVPSVLAPAAEAYLAAGRAADARAAAERGLIALDVLGAAAPDAAALRTRLQRTLDAAQ